MRGGRALQENPNLVPEQSDNEINTNNEPVQEPVQEPTPEELAQKIFDLDKEQKQQAQHTYQYKWNYEQQRAADLADKPAKRARIRGVLVYATIVTTVFVLCFGILLGVLLHDMLTPAAPSNDSVMQGGFGGNVTVVGGGDEQTIELSALESVRNFTVVITVKLEDGVGFGTGIVLTEDGYIVTNYHVVEDAQVITVKFYNGQATVAELVGYSEIDDIAVLKIEARGLYTASIGSSANLQDAQNVYAVGTPASDEYSWTVTKGIVSYAQREVKIYNDEGVLVKKMKMIQTDTPVNPGNSGGPLVNSNGEVLGIITLKLSGQYENIGFAIPIDGAMTIITNIIETGEPGESPITTKRPLIGIVGGGVKAGEYYYAVNEKQEEIFSQRLYADRDGVMVLYLNPQMDAINKLQVGDIIVMADGQELKTIYDLMDVINQHNGGETVQLTFYRNGVANVVDVVLGYAD